MSPARLHIAEPPAQYLLRPPLVVDCSVIAGTVFNEPWRGTADAQIAGRQLHAPYLLQFEITSVAVKKLRHGLADLATDGLRHAASMAVELHRIEEDAVAALAQQYRLSAYDAAYLWLAADLRCPLATFDDQLAAAARAHLASLA
ncbi:type II toxin-antitoxin system VapC family toxin [Ramlibacter henchirensis]|uniref:type II toxin-antitoxin system VapC family toxin n=1 Tax=Ramlibacter henchirensis TaxID=204072 RepID=UPI00143018BE|nr:type II toxin-antitoxin system VapC family toxin [Ramlibacter henchirensis]